MLAPHPSDTVLPDRRGLALRLLGGLLVLALLGLALTSLPGLDEVRQRLADASPAWIGGALLLELGSVLAFVVAFRGVFGGRLHWRRSYDIGMAVQGTNVLVPAGGAGVLEARRLVAARSTGVIAGAIAYMALDLAALAAAFAAIGTVPPLGVLLLAYVLGQLGGLIPVPGGIGGADSGVIGALVLYGTALPAAAAAVLAYRAFQLGLPALLGAVALLRLPRVIAAAEREPQAHVQVLRPRAARGGLVAA